MATVHPEPIRVLLSEDFIGPEFDRLVKAGAKQANLTTLMSTTERGTVNGNAICHLVIETHDGQTFVASTTLALLESAVRTARIAAGPHKE